MTLVKTIRTSLGEIVVTDNLRDVKNRKVVSIQVIPFENHEKKIKRTGIYNTRLIELKGDFSEEQEVFS